MATHGSDAERRNTAVPVALRAADGGRRLGGYALKFDTLSRNLGGFVEKIAPGAVSKSVADRLDVLARFQHRDEFLLGRVSSGTLRLAVDDVGLDYEVDLPDTSTGRDVGELAGRGDLRHSSFAFYTLDDAWETRLGDLPVRTLLQVQLVDVAPVVEPAYLDTSSALRSLACSRGLDLADVAAAAVAGRLAELIPRSASVVDLGDTQTPPAAGREGSDDDGQRDTHPPLALHDRRARLWARRYPAGRSATHPALIA